MGRKPTRLVLSRSQRAELLRAWRLAQGAKPRERLQVVLWAAAGAYTLDDLAGLAGRARSTIQVWMDKFKVGGVAGLLQRDFPPGSTSPIAAAGIQRQFRAGLKAGRWPSAAAMAKWLKDAHGIERSRKSLYYWIRKFDGG